MKKTLMIVNDDGIFSNGIFTLADTLADDFIVTVVAPLEEHSGTSHCISMFRPLNYQEHALSDRFRSFSITGTPCDCVKLGKELLFETAPDFLISGINNGSNLGTDVIYSGTVNAALEGAFCGIPSIAVSQECKNDDYRYAAAFIKRHFDWLFEKIKSGKSILNVNFPDVSEKEPKGVALTTVGNRYFVDSYQHIPERGYMITGYPEVSENAADSDVVKFLDGFITISAIKADFNDKALLAELQRNPL